MLLESESQRFRDKRLRTKTATEGNLLLILLVRKLRTDTGFYTKNESKKNKSGMSQNIKIGSPRNAKRAPSAKQNKAQRWIHKETIGDKSRNRNTQEQEQKVL